MINTFGTCVWHPDQGLDLICAHDREQFPLLTTAVFQCVEADQDWLKVQYGSHIYSVKPEVFKPVPPPKFLLGQKVLVLAKDEIGQVSALTWHFKDFYHIYTISIDKKKSPRRYMEDELSPIK